MRILLATKRLLMTLNLLLAANVLAGCSNKQSPLVQTQPSAQVLFRHYVRGVLPGMATNVHVLEQSLMVSWFYCRFDLPQKDLDLLAQPDSLLPNPKVFTRAGKVLSEMSAYSRSGQPEWWNLPRSKEAVSAKVAGVLTRKDGEPEWQYEIWMAKEKLADGMVRVYVMSVHEPWTGN